MSGPYKNTTSLSNSNSICSTEEHGNTTSCIFGKQPFGDQIPFMLFPLAGRSAFCCKFKESKALQFETVKISQICPTEQAGLFLPLQQVIVPLHINRTTASGDCYFLINCILGLTEAFCTAEHSLSLEMLIKTFEYVVILTAHLRRF